MKLVSSEPCEFRLVRKYTSSQSGSTSFFYTFENEGLGSFELWSKEFMQLEKGKNYNLVFDLTFFNGEKRINLVEVTPIGK